MSREDGKQAQRHRPRGPMIGGPGMAMGPGEKAKDFKGAIKKLINYLGKYKINVLIVMIFAISSTVFAIYGPKVLACAIDTLTNGIIASATGTGAIDFDSILGTLLFLGGLYLISAAFSYIQGWIMSGVTNKVTYRLRQDISKKFHKLPLKYFESTSQGDIISRVTNDVDTINATLSQNIVQLITSITSLIGVLIMMLSINVVMTIVTVLVVPLSAIFTMSIVKRSQKFFAAQQELLGQVNGHAEETYGGQLVIRAFRNEDKRISTFTDINGKLYSTAWKAQFLSGLVMPIVNLIGNIGYVLTCVMGAYFVGRGSMTLGNIQAFIQYVRSFNQPIAQIANITNTLQQTAAAAERVFEFLGEPEEVPEDENPVTVIENEDGTQSLVYRNEKGETRTHPFLGNIEFVNVSFGYDPGKEVIHNFSAFVSAGQRVAIVGHTGAGKTTIVKLLMRFYDVDSGQILIDGIDIRRFTRSSLRSLFGMVLQDTWLYNDTISENIRYGRRDAAIDEVMTASKAAQVDHFVRTLPGGYDVVIDEESSNISAGQKQLLTIARAILADPQVLILDEATSSVDTKTEIDIQRAMGNLMRGRTSFIIAHRLSTIRDCELILMMRDGDIVEQGNHTTLLAEGGYYAELYNSQFEQAG